jgi:hypothetical protein
LAEITDATRTHVAEAPAHELNVHQPADRRRAAGRQHALRDRRGGHALSGQKIGPDVPSLPDGKTGDRVTWVGFLPLRIFCAHPDLIESNRPTARWSSPSTTTPTTRAQRPTTTSSGPSA